MAQNKTKVTEASVEGYLAAISDDERRRDCEALAKRMAKITGQEPKMWGTSIVGFGSYHYVYESGREGDACVVGFSSRKGDISVYLSPTFPEREALLAKLGKHKEGKGCVYLRRLADVDLAVLDRMIEKAVDERKASRKGQLE